MANKYVLTHDRDFAKYSEDIGEKFTKRHRQSFVNPHKSTILILGTPEHFGTVRKFLKFSAKLSPECVLYVSSESWMNAVRSKSNDDADDMSDVYVEKAFSVDDDGNVFLDTFEKPRMCTLLVAMTRLDNLDTDHITCPTAPNDVVKYLSKEIRLDGSEPCMRKHLDSMMLQSQQFLMKNKIFVLLGMSTRGRYNSYAELAKLGVKIVVIHHKFVQCPKGVNKLLVYDYSNHGNEKSHAENIVNLLRREGYNKIDAFSTFSDSCNILSIMVQNLLGVKSLGIVNAGDMEIINNKVLTQMHLSRKPETQSVTSPVFVIQSEEDITSAFTKMSPPAVLKFQSSVGSSGAVQVKNEEDCLKKFCQTQATIATKPCTDLFWNSDSMLLMKYVDGNEHNVELVVYHGRLLMGFVLDKGHTKHPEFIPTLSIYPSHLTTELQALLIEAAFSCIKNVGLSDGIFNVEMKISSCGIKLIEINPRMSGHVQWYWMKQCHNIDLLLYHLMIACDIKPFVPMVNIPSYYLLGMMCHAQAHGKLFDADVLKEIADDNRVEQLIWLEENFNVSPFDRVMCSIVVKDNTLSNVKEKAKDIGETFAITSDSYNLDIFLENIC